MSNLIRLTISLIFRLWPCFLFLAGEGFSKHCHTHSLSTRASVMLQRKMQNLLESKRQSWKNKGLMKNVASDMKLYDLNTLKTQEFFVHRLKGLYNHLKDYPDLMDSRLAVAAKPPDIFEDVISEPISIHNSDRTPLRAKRKLELPLAEACPSISEWLPLNQSKDIHDTDVEVFQPNGSEEESQLGAQVRNGQFFYTTRCINGVEDEPCTGISYLYRSRCITRLGYVMALVRPAGPSNHVLKFDWNWIQIPVSCNCAVARR